MAYGEFDLIAQFFSPASTRAVMGVGDDCALLRPQPGMDWAVSTDTLLEGRHFLSTVPPRRLGHKALAVNLSDLAACAAAPRAFTLALSLPRIDRAWLQAFSEGLLELARAWDIDLVGGDTTAGPLSITLTVMGEVPPGQALLRSGAAPEDVIWVSGQLGMARLALEAWRGQVRLSGEEFERARGYMEMPQPRVGLGLALRGVASSAIDLSDGLLGDLAHVLKASGVGAQLRLADIPQDPAVATQPPALRWPCVLSGGDDYELLFTAAPSRTSQVLQASERSGVPVTAVGRITRQQEVVVLDEQGQVIELSTFGGFDHFCA